MNPDRFPRRRSQNHSSGFTVPLPCFFPVCLAGAPQIPSGSHKKGLSNGTASNRDLLSDGKFLSEISSAFGSRILDWTRGAHLSAQSGAASIAALQPTGRDNRSASVLACPKVGGASKRLMIHYPHGTTALRLSAARLAQHGLDLQCKWSPLVTSTLKASMQ